MMATIRNIGNAREPESESFERSFETLQEVVRRLSEGNLTLQEALSSFEEGMALAERCSAMLEQAELRVKQVSERAMRAGNAAARESASALSALDPDQAGLAAIEIETFESAILFEPLEKPSERGGGTRQSTRPAESDTPRGKPSPRKAPSVLDPLFDDEDD